MANLGTRTSGLKLPNLGVPAVTFNPGRLRYLLFVPKLTIINAAGLATLKATILAGIQNADPFQRWQPTPRIVNPQPQGAEMKKETSALGDERVIMEGKYAWLMEVWKGGKTMHSKLRELNGLEDFYDVFAIDEKNVLLGTKAVDSNNRRALGALSLNQIFTDTFKFNDGSNGTKVQTYISLEDEGQLNDRFEMVELGFNAGAEFAKAAIVDVALSEATPAGAGAGVLVVAAMAGAQNLADRLGTVLNQNTYWVTTRGDTGAAVSITAVAAVPTQGFRLSHTVTSIPTGTELRTRLVDLASLPAGAKGLESDTLIWYAP